jgi:hypothetical protein
MVASSATDFLRGTLQYVIEEDRGVIKGIFYTMYNQNYNFLTFYIYDLNNEHFMLQDFAGNVVLQG